jgi:hypothetical protein
MPKKKKEQTEGPEAPVNQTFSAPGRTSSLIRSVIVADGIDPGYDEAAERGYV